MRAQHIIIGIILAVLCVSSGHAQGVIPPAIAEQFLNANAQPAVNYKLCTYQAGTTTPLATFADVALTVPNTNPIILSNGGFPTTGIYVNPTTAYLYILRSAGTDNTCSTGTPLWTRDNVSAIGGSGIYIPCLLPMSTDSGVVLNTCFKSLPSEGGQVVGISASGVATITTNPYAGVTVPTVLSLCAINAAVHIAIQPLASNTALHGCGYGVTVFTKAANVDVLGWNNIDGVSVSDIGFSCVAATYTQNCISFTQSNNVELARLEVHDANLKGIACTACKHASIHDIWGHDNQQDSISIASNAGAFLAITSVTTGSVNTTLTVSSTSGYANGDQVLVRFATGDTAINGGPYIISNLTGTTFTIPVNTTGIGAYTGSGIVTDEKDNAFDIHINRVHAKYDGVYSYALDTQPASINDPPPHNVYLESWDADESHGPASGGNQAIYCVSIKGGKEISVKNGGCFGAGYESINVGTPPFTADSVTISGNTLINNSNLLASQPNLYVNATNSVISSNVIIDNRGVTLGSWGIQVNNDSGNIFANNVIIGTKSICAPPPATNIFNMNSGSVTITCS